MKLKGRVVVVTGASRGLGAAFAEVLAMAGARVVICARNKAALSALSKKISGSGGFCESYAVDVAKSAEVKKFVAAVIKKHKAIGMLINNAGVIHPKKNIELITENEYRSNMQTNVDSVFYFLKSVIPQMRKQGSGIIVNVSSGAGRRAHPGLSIYSASKFAVEGIAEAVAKELEGTGIKCFALCPGPVNTKMRAAVFGKDDAERQQSPYAVAEILKAILTGKTTVPNGADVHIRNGKITEVTDKLSR